MSFEILPLVEFQLEEGISDREAMMLIESAANTTASSSTKSRGQLYLFVYFNYLLTNFQITNLKLACFSNVISNLIMYIAK